MWCKVFLVNGLLTLAMQVPCIYGKVETSLWPQMPQRQVGDEASMAIMVSMSRVAYILENLLRFLQILSRYYQKHMTPQNVVCISAIISSMLKVKITETSYQWLIARSFLSWRLLYTPQCCDCCKSNVSNIHKELLTDY